MREFINIKPNSKKPKQDLHKGIDKINNLSMEYTQHKEERSHKGSDTIEMSYTPK